MTNLEIGIAPASTKFALLCEFVVKQRTAHDAAESASLGSVDYPRRTRELVTAGYLERTDRKANGSPIFRITPEGRAVCRRLKRLAAKA